MNSLGIAIDGGRYIRVVSRIGERPRSVRLRALNADQRSAVIDFCRFRKNGPDIIRSYRIGNLDTSSASPAEFRLRIERRSFAVWEARINSPGGRSETVRLRTRVGLWPLFFPAAALAGILIWMLLLPPAFLTGSRLPESVGSLSTGNEKPSATDSSSVEEPVLQDAQVSGSPESPIVEPEEPTADIESAEAPETSSGSEAGSALDSEMEVTESEQAAEMPPSDLLPEPLIIYFQPESAILSPRAQEELRSLVRYIGDDTSLLIEGHSADFGTERGQRALSVLRARNTADYIASVHREPVTMEIEGYGTERPATRNPDRQNMNRRVVVTFRETGG